MGTNLSTSLADKIAASSLRVYPQPASDFFRMGNLNADQSGGLICDISGKGVQKITNANEKVDVSILAPGYYHLIIYTSAGEKHGRLIISR